MSLYQILSSSPAPADRRSNITDEEIKAITAAQHRFYYNIGAEEMGIAADWCRSSVEAAAKALEDGVVDRTLPFALRTLAHAIDQLTLSQRSLDRTLRHLAGWDANDDKMGGEFDNAIG